MALAFVFPGQGSQKTGMGKALFDAHPSARAAFEEADKALDAPISKLCFEGPDEALQLTANTQPAILATSVAACRALLSRGAPEPHWVAGHSLGEYAALVAKRTIELGDAVAAVRRRGQYMQEAVPVGQGAMAAILNLDLDKIVEACREAAEGEVVSPANINCPGQVVIAGHKGAVERAMARCKEKGAKRALALPVSAPFHCSLMMPAQERMAKDLAAMTFRDTATPLVNNVDGHIVKSGQECRDGLVRQVSGAVRWQASVELMVREGVDTFVEIGPGAVLSGLIRKIDKNVRVLNVEDPESLDKTVTALAGGA